MRVDTVASFVCKFLLASEKTCHDDVTSASSARVSNSGERAGQVRAWHCIRPEAIDCEDQPLSSPQLTITPDTSHVLPSCIRCRCRRLLKEVGLIGQCVLGLAMTNTHLRLHSRGNSAYSTLRTIVTATGRLPPTIGSSSQCYVISPLSTLVHKRERKRHNCVEIVSPCHQSFYEIVIYKFL